MSMEMGMMQHFQNIWTKRDYLQTPADLNKNIGKGVYVLFEDSFMVASSRKSDMDAYLEETGMLEKYIDDNDKIELFYGLIIDPKALPKDTPKMAENYSIYVIAPDNGVIDYSDVDSLDKAIKGIESLFAYDTDLTIDDVALVYGTPINMKLQIIAPDKFITNEDRKEFLIYDSNH